MRREFGEILSDLPDAHWGEGCHFVDGDRGLSEWLFSATGEDGVRFEVKGCDVFVFRDGKIACKDTYLKQ